MTITHRSVPEWPDALRRYLIASALLHFAWELLQLPLYTIWAEPIGRQVFAALHCTIGDVMIAGLSLLISLAWIGKSEWTGSSLTSVWRFLLSLGVGYTLYSEWINVSVKGSWAYAPLMPTLPVIGTGLSPLLQWIIVPTLVLRISVGRWPWHNRSLWSH
jgi:hypothetical protein